LSHLREINRNYSKRYKKIIKRIEIIRNVTKNNIGMKKRRFAIQIVGFTEFFITFLQITEALLFLHGNCKFLHRNVCPTSIIITKRGTWKLSGFEFIGESNLVIPHTKNKDTNRSLSIFSQYQSTFHQLKYRLRIYTLVLPSNCSKLNTTKHKPSYK